MLRLRPYKACDAAFIVKWCTDEIAFRKWTADRYKCFPITSDDMNNYYDGFANADNFYPMTAFDETGIVGHLIMRFVDADKKVLRFGFIIVDNTKRGKGYGKEMLRVAIKYAFDILKCSKITLGVFENNPDAYYCYKSAGFKDVAMDEDNYFHVMGKDWKCLEMEIIG